MSIDPSRTAFIFPGQGSQALSMGAELAKADRIAAAVFAEADEILEMDLSGICWEGPVEVLNDTEHAQPALLTPSVAVLRSLEARFPGFRPAHTAGHSLGEFSALVTANSLGFQDALHLVRQRGLAMKEAGEVNPGGMAAVLGLEVEAVEAACGQVSDEVEGGVWVANDNCPGQVVISGEESALSAAAPLLEELGARRVVRLAVSIAAHSPLMKPAQDRFSRALNATSIADPDLPVIGNVSAQPLRSSADVREDLNAQLTENVRWTEIIHFLLERGTTTFVELGPGKVLTGLIRRIERSASLINLDAPASFEPLSTLGLRRPDR